MSPLGLLVVGAPREALERVQATLAVLPARMPVPVALVLHRGRHEVLAGPLGHRCPLPVVEPDDKEALLPGRVYLAPAGYHLLVDGGFACLSREPAEHGQRPAINALFESASEAHGPGVAGLLFSGHEDGWAGLSVLREQGGRAAVTPPGDEAEGVERVAPGEVKGWLERLISGTRGKVQP
ncbi:two-component system, chemotaxis family, response regulator CheB [Stigmatella aurantiaca]|uniref:protein-glutamate methylesterase n=1 Tax=Stigmatella aurantiaca TaxID=41 RepID=A0A1H7YQT3_STIAU|nr:chemotaxis protein CheB [Stigmatella aurantiaca]SEM48214.1 two-component system, chemotaxis family, response regulator CheB [Stigmatella aurantiaca]